MIERGGGLGLTLKAFPNILVAQQMARKKLQRNEPLEFGVLGLIDNAHAALADFLEDAVVRDCLADQDVRIVPLLAWGFG